MTTGDRFPFSLIRALGDLFNWFIEQFPLPALLAMATLAGGFLIILVLHLIGSNSTYHHVYKTDRHGRFQPIPVARHKPATDHREAAARGDFSVQAHANRFGKPRAVRHSY